MGNVSASVELWVLGEHSASVSLLKPARRERGASSGLAGSEVFPNSEQSRASFQIEIHPSLLQCTCSLAMFADHKKSTTNISLNFPIITAFLFLLASSS